MLEDAVKDHDHNLEAFLQRCAVRGIRLNSNKVHLRRQEVPFIGHVATDKGLRAEMRAEMMAKCHATHIGIEGCVRRARESMYW